MPWRSQRHHHIKLFADTSSYGWGGLLSDTAVFVEISNYWDHATRSKDIVVKESLALANVLLAFQDSIRNSWIDVFSDSEVLVKAWRRQCARSPAFIAALKRVFAVLSLLNAEIQLFHIRSEDNPADHPSRRLSLQDAKLNSNQREFIQRRFGEEHGHSVDLMALPSNCQLDLEEKLLPFFSPYPTALSAGVNVFAQTPHTSNANLFINPYVFPPICLISQIFEFLKSLHVPFTIVVPDVNPRKFWWPILCAASKFRVLLASAGSSSGVLLAHSKDGYSNDWSLPWDLWVFPISPVSDCDFFRTFLLN